MVHPMDGTQFFPNFSAKVEDPKPGFKWEWIHYEVKGITGNDVKHFIYLAPGYFKNPITFETNNTSKHYDSVDGTDDFSKSAFYSTPGNPKGFLSIGLQIPIDETIQSIQLATRSGQPKYTIFELGKMDPVTAK